MKKGIYINQIIRDLIAITILFWLFSNNNGLMKFIIMPFIICLLLSIGKSICLIIGKDKYKYANIFNKLYALVFLLFASCFLIFWSYTIIKNNNYLTLLFTIPFWLMEIHFIRKYFFKKSQKDLSNKRKSKFNLKIIFSCLLVLAVLASGFLCLFIGIKDTYNFNQKTKDYVTTDFKDYNIYNIDEEGTTYKLIYEYEVDGKKYMVSTDYGVEKIPAVNSVRKVKYDPNNYEKAVLVGTNRNNGLIYFGAFFVLGGMVFVLIFLQIKGVFDKIKIDVIGTYIGVIFTIIGIGIILLQNGMTSSFIETVKTMGFWILIPFMFIIVGIFQTIKCLLLPKLKR